jgi:mannose-6-phosphate isomerase-like protein (cupin superfamily)
MFQPPLEVLYASKVVHKVWGVEFWLVNNDLYCAKLLQVFPGYQCSLHRHKIKDETFLVLDQSVTLEQRDVRDYPISEVLYVGDSRHIAPGTTHRFSNYGMFPAWILETSTTHSDLDVVRIEESRRTE